MKVASRFLPALAVLLCTLSLPSGAQAESVVVVVGASSNAPKLNAEQVSAIFLGTVKSFPNGEKAIPVDQTVGSPTYVKFYTQAIGRNESQMKAYWSRMVFTGKGSAPQEVGNAAAVKKLLADNPNLVGYIDASMVDSSIKIIAEIK